MSESGHPHRPATPAWPPRSAPRLFITPDDPPPAPGGPLRIEGTQAHYLLRVMRMKPDDAVIICDDITGEWAARIITCGRHDLALEYVRHLRLREVVPDFTLCAALLKKERFDLLLEKACELGVRHIQPVLTRRCVADRLNSQRARTILTEAAEQCARTALPTLGTPVPLVTLLRSWGDSRALFFADECGGDAAAHAFATWRGPAALLIGPEGGFDDAERSMIRAHPQAHAIGLGPRILRSETAAIAGAALWMGVCGDWG